MKNTKRSIIIGNLTNSAQSSLKDVKSFEVRHIKGGENNSVVQLNYNNNNNGNSRSYSYQNVNGRITETGNRPANFNPSNPLSLFGNNFPFG